MYKKSVTKDFEFKKAIITKQNWGKGNTQVIVEDNKIRILVHNFHLATIKTNKLYIYTTPFRYHCNSYTNVTRTNRLNTLLSIYTNRYRLQISGKKLFLVDNLENIKSIVEDVVMIDIY